MPININKRLLLMLVAMLAVFAAGCSNIGTSRGRAAVCENPASIAKPDVLPTDTIVPVSEGPSPVASLPLAGPGRIAYVSDRSGSSQIWLMDEDGANARELAGEGTSNSPAFSKQGLIAFSSNRDDNFEIYAMNADGSVQTRLTNTPGNEVAPAWSPDGKRIAFISDCTGSDEVWVMGNDGSGLTQLTSDKHLAAAPAWSADASKIAYRTDKDKKLQIYVMDSDGQNQHLLIEDATGADWSPDGAKIAFQRRGSDFEIFTAKADGGEPKQLTTDRSNNVKPTWSPSQSAIAFTSDRSGTDQVFVMDANGENPRQLTQGPGFARTPSFGSSPAK